MPQTNLAWPIIPRPSLYRICRGYIPTLEREVSWTSFPRDLERMFNRNGFAMVSYRWLVCNSDKELFTFPHPVTNQHVFDCLALRLFVQCSR